MATTRHWTKTDLEIQSELSGSETGKSPLLYRTGDTELSAGKNIHVSSDVLQLSKMHWRLRDVLIRYLDGDSIVEFHCNKSILAIQSKYFMSAFVTYPGDNQYISMIDLSQVPFDGLILGIILESFFKSQSDADFDLWIHQGNFGKLYYAADYFAFDSFCNASRNYLSCRAFNALSNLKTPLEILEKICMNNLLQILVQEDMEDCESSKSFETFLRLYLISDLKSLVFNIPVSFLCRILKMGLEYSDEKSALAIYIDVYKSLNENDQKELKPFILRYFDTNIIKQEKFLYLDLTDYQILKSKTVTGRLGYPLHLSKILEFRNRAFKFVEFDFEYGGHRMLLLMRISRSDSKYLECFLYRNIIHMHDCLPEFEFTLSDSQDRVLVSRQVLKCPDYIQHTRIRMENKRPVAHCGWSKLIRRSELKSNSRYNLSLVIFGLSSLD